MPPITNGKLPHDMPSGGVYLFTEERRHLYVGRTNDLRGRYGRHCRRGASARHAGFAFILACKTIGKIEAYNSRKLSRSSLMRSQKFAEAFKAAKARIRAMEYRYVEESDKYRQALLEIYGAIVLGTPYSDIRN